MKSLYSRYISEREDKEIIESEHGFATFSIFEKECYLQDIYVVPEYRKTGLASEMADKIAVIARERGCNTLVGSVSTLDKNCTKNTKVLLSYGMNVYKNVGNMIFFKKNIKEGSNG